MIEVIESIDPSLSNGYAEEKDDSAYPGLWDGMKNGMAIGLGYQSSSVFDFSLNKTKGALLGFDPATDWVVGENGIAVDLNGSSGRIVLSNPKKLRTTVGPFTVVAFIEPHFTTASSNKSLFQWGVDSGVDPRIFLRYESASQGWLADSNAAPLGQTNSDLLWDLGESFQIAYTNDGTSSSGQWFKNATSIATTTKTGTPQNPSSFTLAQWGRFITGSVRQFDGKFYSAYFYDRVLTQVELLLLFIDHLAPFRLAEPAPFFVPAVAGAIPHSAFYGPFAGPFVGAF